MNNNKFYSPFEKEKKLFGELMLSSYYLSEDELSELLVEQKYRQGVRLGYMAIEKGYAQASEVMDVLLRQLPISMSYSDTSTLGRK
jgi:hypothetical protein